MRKRNWVALAATTLVMACSDRAPSVPVAADDASTTPAETAVTISVLENDRDPGGTVLAIEAVGAALSGTAIASGTDIVYTPSAGFSGIDTFSYTLTNGDGEFDSATVTVAVIAPSENRNPRATDDVVSTDEDVEILVDVLANDTDADGNSVSIAAMSQPPNGVAIVSGNSISYTPNLEFSGIDVFGYVIDDGNGGFASAKVFVDVGVVDDAPDAVNDSSATIQGAAVAIAVLGNDSDIEGAALALSSVGDGTNGTVTMEGNLAVYMPTGNFSGSDSFVYVVTDGAQTSMATVTVNVNRLDSDRDTLSDYDEKTTTNSSPTLFDTDGDGVPDYYEVAQGTDPNDSTDFTAGLVTGGTVVVDNFEAVNFNTIWTVTGGNASRTSFDRYGTALGSNAVRLRGNGGTITLSTAVDTTTAQDINWTYRIKNGPENPDRREDVVLEYVNNLGVWTEMDRRLGGQGVTAYVTRSGILNSADARHANFKVRFRHVGGSGLCCDDYYVDDISIDGLNFAEPTDTDGDTLGDVFEAGLGTDPALVDTDGDGTPDNVEYLVLRSDPTVADIFPEASPNGGQASCDDISGQTFTVGNLNLSADWFCIDLAENQGTQFTLRTSSVASPLVGSLSLYGPNGVSQIRNSAPATSDPSFTFVAPAAGTYFLIVDKRDGTPGDINDVYYLQQIANGVDSDSDGLSDASEINLYGTDPFNSDSDNDGLGDGAEILIHGTYATVADTDADGIDDGQEVLIHFTDPTLSDTDGDALSDGDEVNTYGTDPLKADTDGGGADDGQEINTDGTDPLDPTDDVVV